VRTNDGFALGFIVEKAIDCNFSVTVKMAPKIPTFGYCAIEGANGEAVI